MPPAAGSGQCRRSLRRPRARPRPARSPDARRSARRCRRPPLTARRGGGFAVAHTGLARSGVRFGSPGHRV